MFCASRGKLGGNAPVRSHLLQPLPMQLSDCVSLYKPATVVDNLELRLETLHMAAATLSWLQNTPAELARQRDFKKEDILEKIMCVPELKAKYEAIPRKQRTVDKLTQIWAAHLQEHPRRWTEVDVTGKGDILPRLVSSWCDWARHHSGQDAFPCGAAQNDWATKHMAEYIDTLYARAIAEKIPGFEGCDPDNDKDRARYRRLLVDLRGIHVCVCVCMCVCGCVPVSAFCWDTIIDTMIQYIMQFVHGSSGQTKQLHQKPRSPGLSLLLSAAYIPLHFLPCGVSLWSPHLMAIATSVLLFVAAPHPPAVSFPMSLYFFPAPSIASLAHVFSSCGLCIPSLSRSFSTHFRSEGLFVRQECA